MKPRKQKNKRLSNSSYCSSEALCLCVYGGRGVLVESVPVAASSPEQQEKADDDEADGREHHSHHGQGRGPVVALLGLLHRQRDELTPLAREILIAPARETGRGRGFNNGADGGGRRRRCVERVESVILTHRTACGCPSGTGRCRGCRNPCTSSGTGPSSSPCLCPSSSLSLVSASPLSSRHPGWRRGLWVCLTWQLDKKTKPIKYI